MVSVVEVSGIEWPKATWPLTSCMPCKRSPSERYTEGKALKSLWDTPTKQKIWCPRQDSNLHSFRHQHLKLACLPIPPPGHAQTWIFEIWWVLEGSNF